MALTTDPALCLLLSGLHPLILVGRSYVEWLPAANAALLLLFVLTCLAHHRAETPCAHPSGQDLDKDLLANEAYTSGYMSFFVKWVFFKVLAGNEGSLRTVGLQAGDSAHASVGWRCWLAVLVSPPSWLVARVTGVTAFARRKEVDVPEHFIYQGQRRCFFLSVSAGEIFTLYFIGKKLLKSITGVVASGPMLLCCF